MTGKSFTKESFVIRLLTKFIKLYSKQVNLQTKTIISSSSDLQTMEGHDNLLSPQKKLAITSVEIYFCYPNTGEKINYRSFFERRLENLEHIVSGQPIFLDRNHALRYSRFMGHAQSILKAYVEDSAIESSSQELYLKRGFLNKELIHGCYPLNQLGKRYVVNPWFNRNLLLQ